MTDKPATVDFGAPDKFGTHLFRVEIPTSRSVPVVIIEDYGYRGLEGGIPREEERVVLVRSELCVLAWAAETANEDEIPVICSKWAALRPEERWWLFAMTVAEAGLPEDTLRGWRRALFHALSDGEKRVPGRKRRRPAEQDLFKLPLFKDSE
jgi:hypothetical protein